MVSVSAAKNIKCSLPSSFFKVRGFIQSTISSGYFIPLNLLGTILCSANMVYYLFVQTIGMSVIWQAFTATSAVRVCQSAGPSRLTAWLGKTTYFCQLSTDVRTSKQTKSDLSTSAVSPRLWMSHLVSCVLAFLNQRRYPTPVRLISLSAWTWPGMMIKKSNSILWLENKHMRNGLWFMRVWINTNNVNRLKHALIILLGCHRSWPRCPAYLPRRSLWKHCMLVVFQWVTGWFACVIIWQRITDGVATFKCVRSCMASSICSTKRCGQGELFLAFVVLKPIYMHQ